MHDLNPARRMYAAFVIGPDGHNIEAVCHEPVDCPLTAGGINQTQVAKAARRHAAVRRSALPSHRPN